MKHWPIYGVVLAFIASAALGQDLSTQTRPQRRASPLKAAPAPKSSAEKPGKYLFNFGSHTEFYDNVQTDSSGGLRKYDFAPTIGFGMTFPLDSEFTFLPELNWVLPRTVDGSKIIKNLFMFRADFGYEAVDWLRLRIGTSIMWLNQHASGGSTQVNNGNSSSTFYYPDENRSSLNNTLDVGGEVLFGSWAIRLQTYIYSVFIEERRQISYTLMGTYYWDR